MLGLMAKIINTIRKNILDKCRSKDAVGLYYISKVFAFNKTEILNTLKKRRKNDTFSGFLYRLEEIRHAYEKFCFAGNADKPPFDEVYCSVKRISRRK